MMPKLGKLRALRQARVMSQADLAERSGVSKWTIMDLEAGRREARYVTTRKLAAALGVEPADLLAAPQEEPL